MATYEFEGKTTEEAVENACRELKLERDEMNFFILEPGSAGIFGLVGTKKARIRVTMEEDIEPEPAPDEMAAGEESSEPVAQPGEEEGVEVAREVLAQLLELIPIEEVGIEAEHKDGAISLEIKGDKSGLLIGRKGRTLDALQFIVNKIVNKRLDRKIQVVIDSENYRQRRKNFLVQMALDMGDKAKRIRKPVATNLLNPRDRRIVHLALREDNELGTKSRGEGALKKILIIPRRQGQGKGSRAQ